MKVEDNSPQTVSVVMCTYNGATYLREQLDSIVKQTYPIHELIVQDDGSSDNTLEIVRDYANRFSFVKIYENEHNLGYNRNFLNAVMKANGDAIAIADQDDIWEPDKLASQMELLKGGNSLVFHNSFLFDASPEKIVAHRHSGIPVFTPLRLALKPFIPGHECVFTRRVLPLLQTITSREEGLPYAYVIALACSSIGTLAYINRGLVLWRRHTSAATYGGKRGPHAAKGLLLSLAAFFSTSKRTRVRRYFSAISCLQFGDAATQRVVRLMQGGAWQLLRACFVCCRHTAALQPNTGLRSRIKALFTPLHVLRESHFLVK